VRVDDSEIESESEPESNRPGLGSHAHTVRSLHPCFIPFDSWFLICLIIGCTCMEDSIFGTSPLSGWRNSCGKVLYIILFANPIWYSLNSQLTVTRRRFQSALRYVYITAYTAILFNFVKHSKAPAYSNRGTKRKSDSAHNSTDTRTPQNPSIVSSGVKSKMS